MLDDPMNDPAAAAAIASRLRFSAERVGEATRRLDARVDAMHFQGPAALRLRAVMAERKIRALRAAGELESLAVTLTSRSA